MYVWPSHNQLRLSIEIRAVKLKPILLESLKTARQHNDTKLMSKMVISMLFISLTMASEICQCLTIQRPPTKCVIGHEAGCDSWALREISCSTKLQQAKDYRQGSR